MQAALRERDARQLLQKLACPFKRSNLCPQSHRLANRLWTPHMLTQFESLVQGEKDRSRSLDNDNKPVLNPLSPSLCTTPRGGPFVDHLSPTLFTRRRLHFLVALLRQLFQQHPHQLAVVAVSPALQSRQSWHPDADCAIPVSAYTSPPLLAETPLPLLLLPVLTCPLLTPLRSLFPSLLSFYPFPKSWDRPFGGRRNGSV